MTALLPPAIVLTAGLGTRLGPLSVVRAKPAVPVAGVPLVVRILRWLAHEGVRSVVLNLHHQPQTITGVVGHGEALGLTVRYSWEPTILGSAGGPRQALPLLGPRFFIINGDTLTDVDLSELCRTHERDGTDVTLAITDNPEPQRYGGVLVGDDGQARGFSPPGPPSWHFVGVQVVESKVFEPLAEGQPAATVGGLYDEMISTGSGRIGTHPSGSRFYDVGTPADYLSTSLALARSEGHETHPIGHHSKVSPTAILTRTIVWDRVTIADGCCLTDCIVADGVRVPPDTVCQETVIVQSGHTPTFSPLNAH